MANIFRLTIPSFFLESLVRASIRLAFGFPAVQLSYILAYKVFFAVIHPPILQMCPAHSSTLR
jgi:hypothetical protein